MSDSLNTNTKAGDESESLESPCSTVVTGSVDLCVRIMVRAAFDYDRDMTRTEIEEALKPFFDDAEIALAREQVLKGIIPARADLSVYL